MPITEEQVDEARDAVAEALAELLELGRRFDARNRELAAPALDRWKSRTASTIAELVSEGEARKFSALSLKPNWVRHEDPEVPLHRCVMYLSALVEEIVAHPENVLTVRGSPPRPVLREPQQQARATPEATPAKTLPMPEDVTLVWLQTHVPMRLWWGGLAIVGSAVGAAFYLGMWFGRNFPPN